MHFLITPSVEGEAPCFIWPENLKGLQFAYSPSLSAIAHGVAKVQFMLRLVHRTSCQWKTGN